jgi:hypothetical protein
VNHALWCVRSVSIRRHCTSSHTPRSALSLLAFVLASTALAEPLIHDGDRVLFIGNSYTWHQGGLDRHLKDVFAAAPEPLALETARFTRSGKELSYLFDSTNVVDTIRDHNWDLVILQGGFSDPVLRPQHPIFREYVRKFNDVIVASGAQPVIWAVWEQKVHQVQWNIWRRIQEVTHEIADSLNMPVVHIGEVWGDIRRTGKDGYWAPANPDEEYAEAEAFLYGDAVHPTALSVHMNTLILYSFLTEQTCVGLDYEDVNGEYANGELEDTVQTRVWNIIQDRLWEGPTSVRSAPFARVQGRIGIAPSVPYALEVYRPNGVLVTRVPFGIGGDAALLNGVGSGAFVVRSHTARHEAARTCVHAR